MKSEKKMLSDHSLFSRRRLGPPIGNSDYKRHCAMMERGSAALLAAIAEGPAMTNAERARRDREIAAAFEAGASRTELARRYCLTPRRISQIAAAHGLHRYAEDQIAQRLRNRGGRPRDHRIAALGDELAHYRKLRRLMGAAFAREALGIAA